MMTRNFGVPMQRARYSTEIILAAFAGRIHRGRRDKCGCSFALGIASQIRASRDSLGAALYDYLSALHSSCMTLSKSS
jgi:hypothetical protein